MKRSVLFSALAVVLGFAACAAADPWDHRGDGDHRGWDRGSDRGAGWDRGGPGGEWASLGMQSFEGRNDRESTFTGWGGRHIERLAFRPVDNDAMCMSVVVTFDNGDKLKLISGRYMMERGRMAIFDLPGRYRNVAKLYMRCRALGDWRVGIEVFTRR